MCDNCDLLSFALSFSRVPWATAMQSNVTEKLAEVLSSIYSKGRVMRLKMITIIALSFRSAKHNCFDERVFCGPSAIWLALPCLYSYSVYRILIVQKQNNLIFNYNKNVLFYVLKKILSLHIKKIFYIKFL